MYFPGNKKKKKKVSILNTATCRRSLFVTTTSIVEEKEKKKTLGYFTDIKNKKDQVIKQCNAKVHSSTSGFTSILLILEVVQNAIRFRF